MLIASSVLIRLGYELGFDLPAPTVMTTLLHVHPSRTADLREPDVLQVDPDVRIEPFVDHFGNLATRIPLPGGPVRLRGSTLIEDSGAPDAVDVQARQLPVEELPPETLRFLMASRFCEVDLLSPVALELFGHVPPGWARVQAICDWVHSRVAFSYAHARPTRTALDVFTERIGVCRDFQHLAVTFCRCLNVPARYAAGYLGDIGVPAAPTPMDFSAWFEVFLGGRWRTFDARHNRPRIGRILMAVGRDATDVAITTTFGPATLAGFRVITEPLP